MSYMKQSQLRLGDVLNFGKHKDCSVQDILDDDPEWLAWIYGQDDDIIDSEVIEELERLELI